MQVLVTDYVWPDLEIERGILQRAGAAVVPAKYGSEPELCELAKDADGILTTWKPVTRSVIKAASHCKAIGRYGIGLDNIDVRYATSVGIVVTNVPIFCLDEVAEHAMALLLSLARKVSFFDRAIKHGKYDLAAETPMFRIKGKTLGLIGFGSIGKRVAEKAQAFGLRVIAHSRSGCANAQSDSSVEFLGFDEVLALSDYLSLHVPLTDQTRHMLNYDAFRKMKPSAFLINTARGAVIDREGLLRALDERLIAGAGLDVFAPEPPDPGDPLILHPRVIATPHAAFSSEESVRDLRITAAYQMLNLLTGRIPESVVNPEVMRQPNLRVSFNGAPPFAPAP
jgi:D-3-phosphoglycerate dehydrogenase / 2-oxoglutarate reductase